MVNLDSEIPAPLQALAFLSSSYENSKSGNESSIEPGLMIGLTPQLAFSATMRYADEDNGWNYTGIDPQLTYRLPSLGLPFNWAVNAGYNAAEDFTPASTADDNSGGGGGGGGVDPGPDGRIGAFSSGISPMHVISGSGVSTDVTPDGIHQHGTSHAHMRLIMDGKLTESTQVVANLIALFPDGEGTEGGNYGYSYGIRQRFTHAWAIGLESIGDLENGGSQEIYLGAYWTPTHHCTLHLGYGRDFGSGDLNYTLQSGVVWRF